MSWQSKFNDPATGKPFEIGGMTRVPGWGIGGAELGRKQLTNFPSAGAFKDAAKFMQGFSSATHIQIGANGVVYVKDLAQNPTQVGGSGQNMVYLRNSSGKWNGSGGWLKLPGMNASDAQVVSSVNRQKVGSAAECQQKTYAAGGNVAVYETGTQLCWGKSKDSGGTNVQLKTGVDTYVFSGKASSSGGHCSDWAQASCRDQTVCVTARGGCVGRFDAFCRQGDRAFSSKACTVGSGYDATTASALKKAALAAKVAYCKQGNNFAKKVCVDFCGALDGGVGGGNASTKNQCNAIYNTACSKPINQKKSICCYKKPVAAADAAVLDKLYPGIVKDPRCINAKCATQSYKEKPIGSLGCATALCSNLANVQAQSGGQALASNLKQVCTLTQQSTSQSTANTTNSSTETINNVTTQPSKPPNWPLIILAGTGALICLMFCSSLVVVVSSGGKKTQP